MLKANFGVPMAASSFAPSAKVSEMLAANAAANAAANGNFKAITFDTPKQNLRGLNKPKCSKCGNVARSRCPFLSCKSCCAKAQNPCPIHVLKQSSTLPNKPPPPTIPSFEPQSADAPSIGASWRLTSLRQLSSAVANSLRARKALTRKDAININKWRLLKLREHIEGNIEIENEAFERYLSIVGLLEEAFSTPDRAEPGGQSASDDISFENEIQNLVASIKVKLKSNPRRADAIRKRVRNLVNEKLMKLKERQDDAADSVSISANDDELDVYRDLKRPKKLDLNRTEKTFETDNLIDSLSKARSKEDIESCMKMKVQLFGQDEKCSVHQYVKKEDDSAVDLSFALPKMCTVVHVDQDMISNGDGHISWASQLAEL